MQGKLTLWLEFFQTSESSLQKATWCQGGQVGDKRDNLDHPTAEKINECDPIKLLKQPTGESQ